VDFSWSPETEALRSDVRQFLAEHLTAELEDRLQRTGVSHDPEFARRLGERGWIAPDWPQDDGAPPLDRFGAKVLADEMARAEAPVYATSTTTMVARVIRAVGSEELQAEILARAVRGEITIALGMSEPEAGSDVAAVQTRARWRDDHWVIDGQKMFTTNGHVTDYVFLLTRTNPDVPRHRGLTTFLVPLDQPGIEVQAVYTLSGERTNITFYSDVHLADRWRIGEVDAGWNALMLSLQDEHSVGFGAHLERLLDETESWAHVPPSPGEASPISRPEVQDRLARRATELEVAQLLEARATWMEANDGVPVAEGPMAKLFSTEALVRAADDLTELVGPDGLRSRSDPTSLRSGRIEHALRFSLGTTIYAGTSEIQRNIIAQRRCELPR
jgi:alkylation response protein AidB-like acyl-CoA dehydrogenase